MEQHLAALRAGPHYSEAIKTWLHTLNACEHPGPDLEMAAYQRQQIAHHFVSEARAAGTAIPPECQPLGLADGIIAGSLAGRGWIPDWSFEGSWEDHSHGDKWHLLFLLRPAAVPAAEALQRSCEAVSCEVEGTIVFSIPDGTLETCPADHPSRERFEQRAAAGCGVAVELVRGRYDAATRQFHVLGVDTSDAGALQHLPPTLGLDNYKLSISPSGYMLNGLSRGNYQGWTNELQAVAVQSLLVMARRQSLAWAMGLQERLCADSVLADLPADLIQMVLFELYLSSSKTTAELAEDHAGRRGRVAMARRAGIMLAG
jgi:hypothetical protein